MPLSLSLSVCPQLRFALNYCLPSTNTKRAKQRISEYAARQGLCLVVHFYTSFCLACCSLSLCVFVS
jgi:hypothetical protein